MPVVVTGTGALSAVGATRGALWEALSRGRDGLRPAPRLASLCRDAPLAGLVPGFDAPRAEGRSHRGLSVAFALTAAREAWVDAGLDGAGIPPHRVALVLGTSIGDDLHEPTPFEAVTEAVAAALDARGPRITVSTACTSSSNAVGVGMDLLRDGVADVVIAGGADVLTPDIHAGFAALGVLSQGKCAPFSEPIGTTLGEGAGFVILERRVDAVARGATPRLALCGYGLSADAFHETSPDPTGSGVSRAILGALLSAGWRADQVEYVNAHGTGTAANDPAEWRGLVLALGDRARAIPVSSSKGLLGHAQGAAGVLELLTAAEALARGAIPQTSNFSRPRPRGPTDPVGQPTPRTAVVDRWLSLNAAFGGANAALAVARPGLARPRVVVPTRPVFVRGAAVVGPHGTTLGEFEAWLADRVPVPDHRVRPFAIDSVLPTASPRGLNPATTFLIAAAARALEDAGLRLRREQQDRAGLMVGTTAVSPTTARDYRASIEAGGLAGISVTAFARMVLNAPAGACAKQLGLRGPTTTLDTGEGSGLVAVAHAARWLAARDDVDLIVAGGFDERDPRRDTAGAGEGAACVVLGREGAVRVAGCGLAGPGRFPEALAQALEAAGLTLDDLDATYGDVVPLLPGRPHVDTRERVGVARASAEVFGLALGLLDLRAGRRGTVLVGCAGSPATTCAVILTRRS